MIQPEFIVEIRTLESPILIEDLISSPSPPSPTSTPIQTLTQISPSSLNVSPPLTLQLSPLPKWLQATTCDSNLSNA
jgi:hypothetical protein